MPDSQNGGKYYCRYNTWTMCAGMAGYYSNSNTNWNSWNVSQVPTPATTLILVEFYAKFNICPANTYEIDDSNAPSINLPCSYSSATANYGSSGWGLNAQDAFTTNPGTPMHSGGWNYGFADGHVKYLQPQQTVGKVTACSDPPGWGAPEGMWTVNPND